MWPLLKMVAMKQDLGLPTKLGEMITEYAYTPIKERMADEISNDDKNHNIMK